MPLTETDVIRIRQFLQKLKSGLIEGMDVYTTYHDSNLAATPSDPTGDGTTGGWHREPTEASNWMSVKTALKDTSGTWGTPIRVFGLQGTDTAGVGMSDDVPRLTQITFIGDGGSKVGWTAGTVEYGGSSYAIDVKAVGDGSTDEFIYWDDADGQTSFKTTGTLATAIGANHHYVCRNDSGVATPAWIQRIILGGVIQANTITATQILVYGLDSNGRLDLSEIGAGDASDVSGAATADEMALIKASLLANWRLDIADLAGRPAGIYPVISITDFSGLAWLDGDKAEINIAHASDTLIAYGFPAIPIDDKQKYKIVIRHKAPVASGSGLHLRLEQYNAPLPPGKTHIGSSSGGTNVQVRTDTVLVLDNGPFPGTSWEVDEYIYTPTAGTKYASFVMGNWSDAGTKEYHVDYVLMYAIPKTAAEIAETASLKWAGETGADITSAHQAATIAGQGDLATMSEAIANVLNMTNAPAEAGADVTGAHQGDISLANLDEKSVDSLVDGTYAKMLANWVKAGDTTKIDGGKISALTILAASILTYNLTAANAAIENLFVKTAHIEELNVTTGKIADNATKIVATASLASARTTSPHGDYTNRVSITMTSEGNAIKVDASAEHYDGDAPSNEGISMRLREGGVVLLETYLPAFGDRFVYSGLRVPGAGSITYYLDIKSDTSTRAWAKDWMIYLVEDKGK